MIPERADVAIIGGGIIGCSIAYHLTKLGITDVVLLERRQLCCGTTWHSVGSVGQLRGNRLLTDLARYTAELFRTLEAETGQPTGYKRPGSIMLALNRERLTEMKRTVSMARAFGVEAEMISIADVRDRCPHVETRDALAGMWLPGDGRTNAIDTTQALAKGARQGGARIVEETEVTGLVVEDGSVTGVDTTRGRIRADAVVLAAGMWSRDFAARHGVALPLHAAEHFYAVTEPVAGLSSGMPMIRVPDESTYYKEDAGKLLFGCLERHAKPWGMEGVPEGFCFDSLPPDLDHFEPILMAAMDRFPLLRETGIQLFFNGPETFTFDGNALIGETAELADLFVACGMNTIGVMSSGGVGKIIAEWIHDRRPPAGFADTDVRRVAPWQANRRYLYDRTVEALGVLYDMAWPNREYLSARGARRSPFHDRLAAAGAIMGERFGWEVPLVFAPDGEAAEIAYSFGPQNWHPWGAAECRMATERVAVADLTAATRVLVSGPDARTLLDRLSTARLPESPDQFAETLWLTDRGTVEATVTITRLSPDSFLVETAAAAEGRALAWLRRQGGEDAAVTILNMSSAYAHLALLGPTSAELLEACGAALGGLDATDCRELELGYARSRVRRDKSLGMEAFHLLIGTEFAPHVLEVLEQQMPGRRLAFAGAYALDALRLEAGVPAWPADLDDTLNPFEAGLAHLVDWRKDNFVGRTALEAVRGQPVRHRLAHLRLPPGSPIIHRKEPILWGSKPLGIVTSGSFGAVTGEPVGMGIVSHPDGVTQALIDSRPVVVEVAGEPVDAEVRLIGPDARARAVASEAIPSTL